LLTGSVVYNQATGDTLAGFRAAKNVEEFVNSNLMYRNDSSYVKKTSAAVDADALYASRSSLWPLCFWKLLLYF
jgi:peptidyl-prolyl cis-trans isomerase D